MKAPVVCHHYETMLERKYNFFFFFFKDLEMPFLCDCIYKISIQTASMVNGGGVDLVRPEMAFGPNVEKRNEKIRKFFPETWIWDLIPVGYVSCTMALLCIYYALQSFLIMQKKK